MNCGTPGSAGIPHTQSAKNRAQAAATAMRIRTDNIRQFLPEQFATDLAWLAVQIELVKLALEHAAFGQKWPYSLKTSSWVLREPDEDN